MNASTVKKDEKKNTREGIQKDSGIQMGNIL